jgi:FdhE protein
VTQDAWLAEHPYLEGMAELEKLVEAAAAEVFLPMPGVPTWNDYLGDFHAGVPLLLSSAVEIDLRPAERAITSFVETLASKPLPEKLANETRALMADLRSELSFPRPVVAWLLRKDTFPPRHAGLLHYLGWTVMARYLHPLVDAFGRWREEEHWLRTYCPLCGAPPAMGQLVGSDPGRLRLLSCGCCGSRWRYRRSGCPFCEAEDDHRLAVLAVEGEDVLRIEYCESCGGYLKTYNGEGNEGVLLRDWTSLHLDVIARDRGFKRYAGSLYQL